MKKERQQGEVEKFDTCAILQKHQCRHNDVHYQIESLNGDPLLAFGSVVYSKLQCGGVLNSPVPASGLPDEPD